MFNFISTISDNIWLFLIGSLVAISCAQVGCFLVLRRLSMMGDAISHSVLLGIVLAFLASGSLSPQYMIPGAIIAGLLTAFLTEFFSDLRTISSDAALGIVFTSFFALGIICLSFFAGQVHLDLDCVLFGEIAFAPFDRLEFQSNDIGPRSFWVLLGLVIFNALFIWVGFRPLKFLSFDEVASKSQGVNSRLWHYLLMAVVSITTVLNIESVGAILVIAMIVVPASSAYLISKNLIGMLILSSLLGLAASFMGVGIAEEFDTSLSASIAVSSGFIFACIILMQQFNKFRPKRYI